MMNLQFHHRSEAQLGRAREVGCNSQKLVAAFEVNNTPLAPLKGGILSRVLSTNSPLEGVRGVSLATCMLQRIPRLACHSVGTFLLARKKLLRWRVMPVLKKMLQA